MLFPDGIIQAQSPFLWLTAKLACYEGSFQNFVLLVLDFFLVIKRWGAYSFVPNFTSGNNYSICFYLFFLVLVFTAAFRQMNKSDGNYNSVFAQKLCCRRY